MLCSNYFCINIKCFPSSMLSLVLLSTNSMQTCQYNLLQQGTCTLFVSHNLLQQVTYALSVCAGAQASTQPAGRAERALPGRGRLRCHQARLPFHLHPSVQGPSSGLPILLLLLLHACANLLFVAGCLSSSVYFYQFCQ